MNDEIPDYFKEIERKVSATYRVVERARKKGFDPEGRASIPLAKNMAERVEGLIGALIPDIIGSGLSERIQELEKKYGKLNPMVALSISLEIVQEKFCKFENRIKAMEAGIRVGLAYLTLGVVSSPLEGFVELKLKKRKDGKEYFCLMYSGPIRSAGGTAGALSVVIADYIRKNMGYGAYDATEKEIRRMVTELYDYHERVTNLQYLPSEKEVRFIVKNLPLQIDGDSSEKIEVSNYKDLDRIETNNIRSGPCLVLGECLAQKASKLWNTISRWPKSFGLEHWSFLENFLALQKRAKAKDDLSKNRILPVYTFIEDLVAGRPVLTYPLAAGGFRLRYGRCRVSGYSSTSIHPSTMHILKKYLATGTQLKIERPGKATAITVCDSIEGPIVKLKDDRVLRLDDENLAKKLKDEVREILFLGDILISYGDFYNRAHTLLPPGYCEEWWGLEFEKAVVDKFGTLNFKKLELLLEIEKPLLESLLKDTINTKIDAKTAFIISRKLDIPLHPKYTYHWNLMSSEDFFYLLRHISSSKINPDNGAVTKLVIKYDDNLESILGKIGVPHLVANHEFIVIENDDAYTMSQLFGLKNSLDDNKIKINDEEDNDPLSIANEISDVKIRDKSGVFIGARMGRPEKAKMRKLTGSPHVLFPIGEEGGRLRSFQSAFDSNKITAEFPNFHCEKCDKKTIFSVCEKCDSATKKKYYCSACGLINNQECRHGSAASYLKQTIDIRNYFDMYLKKLNIKTYPDLIKGVRGTSNREHTPEHFVKGIFRAKYDVCVNKDGTTRYDMTQLPITHFKPQEIRASVEKLKELGYKKDVFDEELTDGGQILELMPQDLILPACNESPELGADKILLKTSLFIDDLLKEFYKLDKFYNMKSENDILGNLVVVLAPHTSAGVVGRIIGFSNTQGFFAHPMFHAATRRDCLTYNNFINIYDGKEWKSMKIGELVESLNPKDKADPFGTLSKKINGFKTFSFNKETNKPEIVDINEVTKHKKSKIIKITTEKGKTLKLTYDHKIYVLENNEIKLKRASELIVGSELFTPEKLTINEENIEEINLLDYYKENDLINIRGIKEGIKEIIAETGTIKDFSEGIGEKYRNIGNYLHRNSFPIKLVVKICSRYSLSIRSLCKRAKISYKRDFVEFPIKVKVDNNFLRFIGLYIAEGFARRKKYSYNQFYISATNKEISSFVEKYAFKEFGLRNTENKKDRITFSSRIFYDLIVNYLKCGKVAKEKRIPSKFLNLPLKKIGYLLSGYFEGDGSISESEKRVTCDSTSDGLLSDLEFVFSRMGVQSRRYKYTKEPGPKLKQFYVSKKRNIPKFTITKLNILSNYLNTFSKFFDFISTSKSAKLSFVLKKKSRRKDKKYGRFLMDEIKKIEYLKEETTYCLNLKNHNFFANNILVHNCDGDEASVTLLMDALLNFSKKYLPDKRGSTQDALLVLTSKLIPAEVDDMAFDLDIGWKYPLQFYESCLEFKQPREVEIEQFGKRLDTERQYHGFGFTHHVSDINSGAVCSAYKVLPSMEEKLKGQMELADKIRAVDESDVARLVIEKHLIRDIRGNLRKFSMQQFRCSTCNEKYRRPPLVGKCLKCDGKIIFTISEGSIIKYLEPAISLADKYNLPSYLKQNLELTKRGVESLFGREKEKQEGLGRWFG